MGCSSSSLKGDEDVGTNAPMPSVPTENPLQPTGAPMKKVKTNFSNVDYDAPAEKHKGSVLKARAPDELDEGPSRNASYAAPATTGDLRGEMKDGILEKPAENTPLEPYHTNGEEPESTSGTDNQQPASRRTSLMGLLTGQEGRRKRSTFTDADLKKYAGITREELGERAKIPPDPTPVPRQGNS